MSCVNNKLLCWTTVVVFLTITLPCHSLRRLPQDAPLLYNYTLDPERRLLRNLNVKVDLPSSPDQHLVGDLPLQSAPFPTQHWAGHLKASKNDDKYFFYWLFAPDASVIPDDAPLIIWLNGGPACSSMDGLWIENGPLRLTLDETTNQYRVTYDEHSWHKAPAYTLYIDQPVGTGLSFTLSHTYPRNDQQVNIDFLYFLQEFFTLHSDKFVDGSNNVVRRPVYFAGESYAGHYIPSMMNYILKDTSSNIKIPLAGAAIGNGWVDPFYQYSGAQFAYGYSLVDQAQVDRLARSEKVCQEKLNGGSYNNAICFDLIDNVIDNAYGQKSHVKPSSYDIRLDEVKGQSREFPKGHKVLETYLGGHSLPSNEQGLLDKTIYTKVLEAIHATASIDAKQQYQECTDPPYMALSGNDGKGVVDDVVSVLNHPDQVRLLFFNGIFDIVCNHVGNERFLEHLPWDKTAQWTVAERYAWMSDSKIAGFMKEYENLLFLKVRDSGHMVPMDVPDIALDMMKLFIYKQSFSSSKQNLQGAVDDDTSCPTCPTCKFSRDSGSNPNSTSSSNTPPEEKQLSPLGHFVISYAWVVAGVGFCAFVAVMVVSRRPGGGMTAAQRAAIVPGYEVEMRESGEYRDVPNGKADDDDAGHSPII